MSRIKEFWDTLLGEFVCYGGMAATRAEVYDDALFSCKFTAIDKLAMTDREADLAAQKAADRFAFLPVALPPEVVAQMPRFDPETRKPKKV